MVPTLAESITTEVKLLLVLGLVVLLLMTLLIILWMWVSISPRLRKRFGIQPGGAGPSRKTPVTPDPWTESAKRLRTDTDDADGDDA